MVRDLLAVSRPHWPLAAIGVVAGVLASGFALFSPQDHRGVAASKEIEREVHKRSQYRVSRIRSGVFIGVR